MELGIFALQGSMDQPVWALALKGAYPCVPFCQVLLYLTVGMYLYMIYNHNIYNIYICNYDQVCLEGILRLYILYVHKRCIIKKNWSKHAVPGSASVGIPFKYSKCTYLWGFDCEYSLKMHHVDDTPKIHRGALQLKRRIHHPTSIHGIYCILQKILLAGLLKGICTFKTSR